MGGDWYDVVASGDGMALVIGDVQGHGVQGHGVQAAATMGQLRRAVRAFALGDRAPDEVMSGVSRLPADLDPGLFASCCYIRLDPATGRARAARAGHPPPLLRHPDGRTEAPARAGAPAARHGGRAPAGVADRLLVTARHGPDRPDGIALLLASRRARPRSPR